MSRFASIKTVKAPPTPRASDPEKPPSIRAASRVGKRAIGGYFSGEMSRALHILALEQDLTLQALMGEAFDDLFRKYGKHPFGER